MDPRMKMTKRIRKTKKKKYIKVGQQYGRLTVVEKGEKIKNRLHWVCKCTCGNITNVLAQSLNNKATTSCGCYHLELCSNNLLNQVFGRWEVIGESPKRSKNGYKFWKCRCECGTIAEVSGEALLTNNTKQCKKCRYEQNKKQFCVNGHDTLIWGRSESYSCKACIKDKALRTNYGITLDEFIALYNYQGGKCCVCQKDLGSYYPKESGFGKGCRIEVDHDHDIPNKRQSVRGLLCGGRFSGCNHKLGKIDHASWLKNAYTYIANPPAQVFLNLTNKENNDKV